MLAEADSARLDGVAGEAGPGADARAGTVSADEITGLEGLAIAVDESAFACGGDALDGVFPVEADAEAGGAIEKDLVEDGPTDAASGSLRKGGFDSGGGAIGRGGMAEETDAA